jgi:carbonic anhydrase/acetyltransferase-like protein (isoleucine patch superfamily)
MQYAADTFPNDVRSTLMDMEPLSLPDPVIHPSAFVAATARVYGSVEIGAGAVVMFGAVLRAELERIVIGEEANLQDNVVVHADRGFPTIVGRRVTVGHAAVIHGAIIGDQCLVGIGALALNGSELGEGSWLAAGSVLPEGRTIPPWTLAVGTPAKPVRELRDDEIARQDEGVEVYRVFGETYRVAGSKSPVASPYTTDADRPSG